MPTPTVGFVRTPAAGSAQAPRGSEPPRPGPSTPHQHRLKIAAALSFFRAYAVPAPVGAKRPGEARVAHDRLERTDELLLRPCVLDRRDDLDPVIEVARHQIGSPEQVAGLAVRLEDEEPAVLEEPAENRAHLDVLPAPSLARPQRAGRPREDFDLDPRVGSLVELVDDLLVREVVQLHANPRLLAGRRGS